MALKIWAYQWTDCKVRIQCDNMAVVEVLASGKTKDKVLPTYAKNIWLIASLYNLFQYISVTLTFMECLHVRIAKWPVLVFIWLLLELYTV